MLPTGDSYEGQFKSGHRSGFGILKRQADVKSGYKGEWRNDLRHGPGEERWEDGTKFEGVWENGKQLYGALEWTQDVEGKATLCKYEGRLDGGNLEGYGVMLAGGRRLEGIWKASLLEGDGEETWLDGSGRYYKGTWKQGMRTGKGESGDSVGTYKGSFANGTYEGTGEMKFSDGSSYVGDWRKGLFHGRGELRGKDGEQYTGEFAQGKKAGNGTVRYANGGTYTGHWKDGKRDGQGTMRWNLDDSYVGDFMEDKYQGKGVLRMKVRGGAAKDAAILIHGEAREEAHWETYDGEFVNGLADGKGTLTRVHEEMENYVAVKRTEVYTGEFVRGEFSGNGSYTYKDCTRYVGQWRGGVRDGFGKLYGADGRVQYEGLFVKNYPAGQLGQEGTINTRGAK